MAVFLTLFVVYIVAFLIISWLIRTFAPGDLADYAVFLSCVAAVPFALLAIWIVERTLKNVWHSGLSVQLAPEGVYVEDMRYGQPPLSPTDPPTIEWSKPFIQLDWYFKLTGYPRGGRERRVNDNWLCVCTELQQDENRLNTFTFMPPATAAPLVDPATGRTTFHLLNPAEVYGTDIRSRFGPPARPTIPTTLLHSKDGRYWLAERRRWEIGVELAPEDFLTVMAQSHAAGSTDTDSGQTTNDQPSPGRSETVPPVSL